VKEWIIRRWAFCGKDRSMFFFFQGEGKLLCAENFWNLRRHCRNRIFNFLMMNICMQYALISYQMTGYHLSSMFLLGYLVSLFMICPKFVLIKPAIYWLQGHIHSGYLISACAGRGISCLQGFKQAEP
jgi:hypothetical protein